jgi:hypothetical protein
MHKGDIDDDGDNNNDSNNVASLRNTFIFDPKICLAKFMRLFLNNTTAKSLKLCVSDKYYIYQRLMTCAMTAAIIVCL